MSMNDLHQAKLDKEFRHLRRGEKYRVLREFSDHDGVPHAVGEIWEFIGSNFVPYHDGLSLFAIIDGQEQQVRLQWIQEEQGALIEALDEYLEPCQ